jgi:hypothetical protein
VTDIAVDWDRSSAAVTDIAVDWNCSSAAAAAADTAVGRNSSWDQGPRYHTDRMSYRRRPAARGPVRKNNLDRRHSRGCRRSRDHKERHNPDKLYLSENEGVSARIKELQTAVADGVIVLEVRKRSARVRAAEEMSQWKNPSRSATPSKLALQTGIGIGTRTEGLSTGAFSVIDLGASEIAVIVPVQDQLGHDSIANMWRSPTRAASSPGAPVT